ncbi:MAG: hypothetical protein ACYTEL_03545 [Planctomycetota bacterium]|jgi:hypothetical protein
MGRLQGEVPKNRPVGTSSQQSFQSEEEIDLTVYLRVLWKRKLLVLLGSVLPPLAVGLILLVLPKEFEVTYVYDVDQPAFDVEERDVDEAGGRDAYPTLAWNLDKKHLNMLLDKFYSNENVAKIIDKLAEKGLSRYAELVGRVQAREGLQELVAFDVFPPYPDMSKVKAVDLALLEQLRRFQAQLLKMTVRAGNSGEIHSIASVIKDNFERVVPVYAAAGVINDTVKLCKSRMADIEENRFNLGLELRTTSSILEKLRKVQSATPSGTEGGVVLQFDVGDKQEYLPLGYQIQAAESKSVALEEEIKAGDEKYDYLKDVLMLNEKFSAELTSGASSHYTIHDFYSFLTDLAGNYEDKELKDYLSSYIKRLENRISASKSVIERPKVNAISKQIVKKSVVVLAICFVISIFAAFLSASFQRSNARVQQGSRC